MAQQNITLGMTGEAALEAINGNTTELYANISLPFRLPGMAANTQQAIAADTMVKYISVSAVSGAPVLRIGITPNGIELLPDTPVGNSLPVDAQQYYPAAGFVYFTLAGGTINARIDYVLKYYGI